jgi:hypothetical protein
MGRMTNIPSLTNIGENRPPDSRRRQIRWTQLLFAGAVAAGAVALFSATPSVVAGAVVASRSAPGIAVAPVDDTNFVNDQGQNSGDIFTQNAQDQSTASGAGTS